MIPAHLGWDRPQADRPAGAARTSTVPRVSENGDSFGKQGWEDRYGRQVRREAWGRDIEQVWGTGARNRYEKTGVVTSRGADRCGGRCWKQVAEVGTGASKREDRGHQLGRSELPVAVRLYR